MKRYIPGSIEAKWQKRWAKDGLYETNLEHYKNKFYTLVELPYCSGDLHMGHWFTFSYGDILSRFKRMQGFNVVFPIGFDAFGLPAENAAIKRGIHPNDWAYSNIKSMIKQFKTMGNMFDWRYSTIACDPDYYKWNQWIFLKMLEKGIAYKGKALSSWCSTDQTVLAEENIENGKCWRCGSEVVKKEVDQWFLKITAYADRLIWPETPSVDWPKSLRDAQNSWIGRSEGVVVGFDDIEVFTTRPDTIFGATFMVLSPEYPELKKFVTPDRKKQVEEYIAKAKKKSEQERKENKDKIGVFTGGFVKNPFTDNKIQVWVADYVLPGYGTGAIMAVPAHDERDFEFAKKNNLEIKRVITGKEDMPYTGEGILVSSGEYSGLRSEEAREKISKSIVKHHLGKIKVNYHLRDWSISRQRYWGTPIPVIYCASCGVVPVPFEDLPVKLPYKVDFLPKGKAPLATAQEWVDVKCPKCGGRAERETETLDGFMDNSWYFLRYLDPHNSLKIFDKEIINNWFPLEIYIGGAEHTFGHALYSRFFTKFFFDLGIVNFDEYAKKRIHHGVILGQDGQRMSKSKGNVINPDEEVNKFGADAVRLYLSFLGPIEIVTPWNPDGISGVYHFLQRVWGLLDKVGKVVPDDNDLRMMHKTIKKVETDLGGMKNNTAIASIMQWLNYLSRKAAVSKQEYHTLLLLLAPLAPHITEELWQIMGEKYSIHLQPWPKSEERYIKEEKLTVAVQVNGKVREILLIDKEIVEDSLKVEQLALASTKVQKHMQGLTPKKIIYIRGRVLNLVV